MTIIPTPYSQFITQDFILSESGGPWHCSGFAHRPCIAQNAWFTSNQTAISSYLDANDPSSYSTMSLQASVLVDPTPFGGGNVLAYNWSFFATSLGSLARSPESFQTKVGAGNRIDIAYVTVQDVKNNATWANATYFHYTGNALLRGVGTKMTLDLSLNLTFFHEPEEFVGLSFRSLHLELGSAPDTYTSVASPQASSDTGSLGPLPNSSTLSTSTSTAAPNAGGRGIDSSIIAYSVTGVICLVVLIVLGVLLWKKHGTLRGRSTFKVKEVKGPVPLSADDLSMNVINTTQQNFSAITPFHSGQVPHPIGQSNSPPTSTGPRRERRKRESHLNPPPPYLENPPLPLVTVEQLDTVNIIRPTPQKRRPNSQIAIS